MAGKARWASRLVGLAMILGALVALQVIESQFRRLADSREALDARPESAREAPSDLRRAPRAPRTGRDAAPRSERGSSSAADDGPEVGKAEPGEPGDGRDDRGDGRVESWTEIPPNAVW